MQRLISINKRPGELRVIRRPSSLAFDGETAGETARLFDGGKSRRLPPDIRKRALIRLGQLHAAIRLEELRLPPTNQLEALKDDRVGTFDPDQ